MKKKMEKLIERFKQVESEIVSILKDNPIDFNETDDKFAIKKAIKEYLKKMNRAKRLFSEYEEIAKQIEDANHDDEDESAELSKIVLEIREGEMSETLSQAYGTESDVVLEKLKKKDLKSKGKKQEKESGKQR